MEFNEEAFFLLQMSDKASWLIMLQHGVIWLKSTNVKAPFLILLNQPNCWLIMSEHGFSFWSRLYSWSHATHQCKCTLREAVLQMQSKMHRWNGILWLQLRRWASIWQFYAQDSFHETALQSHVIPFSLPPLVSYLKVAFI